MKITIHTLATLNRHGQYFECFGTLEAAEKEAAKYCREKFDHDIADEEDTEFDSMTDRELVDYCMENFASDDDNIEFDKEEITLQAPTHPVAAARMAVVALAHARDCMKAAGAKRAIDKVRLALSSAKGAVRHVQNMETRS